MKIDILTLFPEMLRPMLSGSILGRAVSAGLLDVQLTNIRDYTENKHRCTDDYPFGGGAGMVMFAQPIVDAVRARDPEHRARRIYLSPRGRTLTQRVVEELAQECHMSETHFRRLFESCMNMSPVDYINLVRIQKACDLLKKTTDSMDIVAQKVGFTTTSTFNRNFKKFLNTSPYQWKINPENYETKLLNYNISARKGW